jgi:uncharacterized protein YbjT (DUF2867 family)
MKKLLLFGATGNLGKEIAKEAVKEGYDLTMVVRNAEKAAKLSKISEKIIVVDAGNQAALKNICNGFDSVISALGKSVSPNDFSRPSFEEVDFKMNKNILLEAQSSKVKKFVYVSAFHAEKYVHLEYFRVHHAFSTLLMASALDYSIIKPPAIFSGFLDMFDMAKKGVLFNIGDGDKKTNPIYEGDLAKACIAAIWKKNAVIELGGKSIYTRKQLYEIIQDEISPNKSLKNVPLWLFKVTLPMLKVLNRNMYDKFAFFTTVIQHDTIASQVGEMDFQTYVKMQRENP